MTISPLILVTGANGFVGKALCAALESQGISYRSTVRKKRRHDDIEVGDIEEQTNWSTALQSCRVVIHLAARVHVMRETEGNALDEFRKTNLLATANLARSAAHAGVKRMVYVSSIGVNGLRTTLQTPFTERDVPNPHNAYAISKWEAEQALRDIEEETGLEVVVVRPPLVYGPNAPGNFALMMNVLGNRIPLPLASVNNLRSLVYIENLVDALILCATHSAASGKTYLVSDNEEISTPDLLQQIGKGIGKSVNLLPCPPMLLKLAGNLLGKSDMVDRLLDSLRVDNGKIRLDLNWNPPYSLQEGLDITTERFATSKNETNL